MVTTTRSRASTDHHTLSVRGTVFRPSTSMFAQANQNDDPAAVAIGKPDRTPIHPAADVDERSGMYSDRQTGVAIASGGPSDPPYVVVMPDGTVHDAGLADGDTLDIDTVQALLDRYGMQVYQ